MSSCCRMSRCQKHNPQGRCCHWSEDPSVVHVKLRPIPSKICRPAECAPARHLGARDISKRVFPFSGRARHVQGRQDRALHRRATYERLGRRLRLAEPPPALLLKITTGATTREMPASVGCRPSRTSGCIREQQAQIAVLRDLGSATYRMARIQIRQGERGSVRARDSDPALRPA
jgi:hypothetical protein